MVNRILFTYWEQGLTNAPPVVRMCVERMQQMNPGWNIRVLHGESAGPELGEIPIGRQKFRSLQIPHQSDLLRTHLLIKYGGVWADPTVYFAKPLDDWIDEMTKSGLFLFTNPGRDRLISNWFIASAPENPLLVDHYQRLCAFWNDNEFINIGSPPGRVERFLARVLNRNVQLPRFWLRWPIRRLLRLVPYMVYHYQFCDLVEGDSDCRKRWQEAGKLPAQGPVRLLRHGLLNPMCAEVKDALEEPLAPVFKLTWKLPTNETPADSVLDYLFNQVYGIAHLKTAGRAE